MINSEKFKKKLKKIKTKGERQKIKYEIESKYAKYYPSKNGTKVSNIMLAIIVASIVIYTVASFWLTYKTGVSIDSTLTTCFYAFWTVEVLSLAGIRISKVRKETNFDVACTHENEECECTEESI